MQTAPTTRILVVDDEPGVLETIAEILRREGYEVVAVQDIDAALRHLEATRFEVVLTDLRLEAASGLHLIAELRRRWSDTAAIVLTGYASLQSAIDALREGVYDYLVKPCAVEELKATVARAVERGVLSRQLRERVEELDVANAKLKMFNEELQRRVGEATTALNEKIHELAETNDRLEEAQRQREEFISMIAHELGQPLTTINGYAQLLGRKGASRDEQERARNRVVASTHRLARLVQDLSDASHLASGHFRVSPVTCDLVGVVEEQTESARANTENHTIRVEIPPTPVQAEVDRDRIAQVLSNLLSNAIKYTEGGEVHVSLRSEKGHVVIQVRDDGPGIPPDRLAMIFEPRVRLARGDSGRATGDGLGLYIAKGIVEAHGGRIWAENSKHKGAVFTIRLPLSPRSGRSSEK